MSVYLNSVRIAGVMGIPSELPLDLTAPLTLIYAPNGTGKTSTWMAIKALLTMGVETEISCQATAAAPAKVVGELEIGGSRYTATATPGRLVLASETDVRLTDTNALAKLAPEVDTTGIQTRGGVLRDRLVSQIESCRFLPSESLLYLIDSSEESTELRRKLFADLTGTSVMQTELRETRRYRDKLSEEIGSLNRSLQTIEEQIRTFSVAYNPDSSDSLHLIAQAAAAAGVELPPEVSAQETLALLREAQTSKAVAVETIRSAYSSLRSIEATYSELDRDLAEAFGALKSASGARERAERALSVSRKELESSSAKREQQLYEKFQLGLTRVVRLVAAEGRTKLLTGSAVASLRELLRQFESEHTIESRLGALQQLNDARQRYREQTSERLDLLEKRKNLSSELQISSADLQASLREATTMHSELRTKIDRQVNLTASLRTSAQALVTASRSSACPCCSHDWQTIDALLAAIAEGDRGTYVDPILKAELEAIESKIGTLQTQQASARAIEDQLRQWEKRLSELATSIERTERLARDNDVLPARLLDSVDTLEEVYTLRSYLDLWRILEALDDLSSELDETQSVESVLSALSLHGEALKTLAAQVEQVETERRAIVERDRGALLSSLELGTLCESQVNKLTRIKHDRDAAIERLRSNGVLVDSQTQTLLNERMTALERLNNLIAQISAAVEASAAIAAREKIAANQKALEAEQSRIQQEVEQAERLIQLITQAEQHAGQQFFDRLGHAVATLFDHMQVNRVFRNLEISAVKESFHLNGRLDDKVSLDPGSHFSQGQRQDLALSMFLVRAASLGGSFFLDEPLVHLDDLNRTALLDCLRACVIGSAASRPVRLVVTTASWSVARHLMQKFSGTNQAGSSPLLRVIQLSGNVKHGLTHDVVFPVGPSDANFVVH